MQERAQNTANISLHTLPLVIIFTYEKRALSKSTP